MRKRCDNVMDIEIEDTIPSYHRRDSKFRSISHRSPTLVSFLIVLILISTFGCVFYMDSQLPKPLNIFDEQKHPKEFIAERAQKILEKLTNLGPRVIGSPQNENKAVEILLEEIKQVTSTANPRQKIEVDLQTVSGHYYLNYKPVGFVNAYNNIQNIIVKIHGTNPSSSLLINAHFDSVPTSPGASDDGIMCAVMLEILRKVSEWHDQPLHNLIFLFNGAEELALQASHGFITQHKWANETKVVINLEAAGHGGREQLFQTGPRVSWLLKYYKNVPFPTGQACGEEIFQSNIIPSDTDFRIFRDFGGLVGYDFAFTRNGYRYHTKYDSFKDLPIGSYQHVGSNILHLVSELAYAPELESPKDYGRENIVYYDFFGHFMVSYSMNIAIVINIFVVLLSFGIGIISLRQFGHGVSYYTSKYIICSYTFIFLGWILSAISVFLISFIIDITHFNMSWYAKPYLLFGLYCAPILMLMILSLNIINYIRREHKLSINIQTQIHLHLTRFIWTLVLLIGTILNIRSVYAIMIPVLCTSSAFILIKILGQIYSRKVWQIIYLCSTIIPMAFLMQQTITVVTLFIPITGRMSTEKNPDLIIGLIVLILMILITSFIVPLISLAHSPRYMIYFLSAIFIVTFTIIFTPLGFPYSGDPSSPAPERFMIHHTNRVHRTINNTIIEQKSGIYLFNLDRNSPHRVSKYVKSLANVVSPEEDCKKYLVCGFPVSSPKMVSYVKHSITWIPFEEAPTNADTSLTLTSKSRVDGTDVIRLGFSAKGPNMLDIFMKPKEGCHIVSSTYNLKKANDYVFMHFMSGTPNPVYNFTVDITSPKGWSESLLDIAITGKYLYGKGPISKNFSQFLHEFPNWADLVVFTASYNSYVF